MWQKSYEEDSKVPFIKADTIQSRFFLEGGRKATDVIARNNKS